MWARTLIAAAVLLSTIVNPVHGAFCTPEKQCWPKDATLERWANSLTSPNTTITTPETPGFLGVALVMNELKSNFPAMVVAPGNEADLVSTVKMAAKHRIRLVARCSGHDYNDRSTGRGIIQLNTQLLKSIEYDPVSTDMTIAAGCNFLEIYKFAEGINRAVVGGQSATVCLAGYLMGGGHSNLSPVYGLGIDNVISIRFALYNGTVLTLTPTDNADLFNALLGSGANTYGVLISVRYKTYPAAPYVTAISGIWMSPMKLGDPSVLDYIFNLTWYLAKPNNLVAPYVTFGTEGNNYTSIKFYISNPDYQAALDYLDPLFALPSFVRKDATNYSSIYEYSLAIYGSKGDTGQIWQRKFLSNVMLPLDQELLDRAKAVTIEQQSQTGFKLLLVHGGVSMEGTAGAVPRGLRQSLGELAFGDQWDDPTEDIFRIKRISDVMDKLKFVNATYVNEYTTFYGIYNVLDDWRTRFYSNYTHLLEVKAKYDPCNLYVVEYGVGSEMRRAVCGL